MTDGDIVDAIGDVAAEDDAKTTTVIIIIRSRNRKTAYRNDAGKSERKNARRDRKIWTAGIK